MRARERNSFFSCLFRGSELDRFRKKIALLISVIFVLGIAVVVLASPVIAYEYVHADKIYRGVSIDGIEVGGLTKEGAIQKLNQQIDLLKQRGLTFGYQG